MVADPQYVVMTELSAMGAGRSRGYQNADKRLGNGGFLSRRPPQVEVGTGRMWFRVRWMQEEEVCCRVVEELEG